MKIYKKRENISHFMIVLHFSKYLLLLSNISFFFVRLILITSFFDLSKIVTNNLLQRYYSASCDSIHTRLIEQIYKSDRVSSIYVSHSIVIKMKLLTHFPACTFVNKICESDIEFQ